MTHCKYGHEMTSENTWEDAGTSYCLACARRPIAMKRRKRALMGMAGPGRTMQRSANGSKTHCKRNHEFTPENTLVYAGRRHCRECNRIRVHEYRARKRAVLAGEQLTWVNTHCKNGHEYTPENTYYYAAEGVRSCRACQRETEKRSRNKCAHGHEFTPENTVYDGGRRHCLACRERREAEKRERAALRAAQRPTRANAAKTHCPQGHEYTPENTLISAGRRHCRTCSAKRSREYQALKRREAGVTRSGTTRDIAKVATASLIKRMERATDFKLIRRMEREEDFVYDAETIELNRRLAGTGYAWRWSKDSYRPRVIVYALEASNTSL